MKGKAGYGKTPAKNQKKGWRAEDYVSPSASIDLVNEIKTSFDIFDVNLNGKIESGELLKVFQSLGLDKVNEYSHQKISSYKVDLAEGIDFDEFFKMATKKVSQNETRSQINAIFKSYDKRGHGKISADELKKISRDMGEELSDEQVDKIFEKAGKQQPYLNSDDFYNIMTYKGYYE